MVRDTCPDLGALGDRWRVMLPSGEQAMTLQQLDEAFEAGQIDAATLVCPPGSLAFARLGAMAGLDADAAHSAEAEVSVDVDFEFRVMAPSLVSADDARAFRPRWSVQRLLALPAALAAIAIIAFAAQASASSETPASPPVAEIASLPPVAEAKPAAVAAAPAPPPVLTESQKKALSAKDKKAEASRNAKRAPVAPHRAAAKKGSAPFSKGGNKHDPLNGAL